MDEEAAKNELITLGNAPVAPEMLFHKEDFKTGRLSISVLWRAVWGLGGPIWFLIFIALACIMMVSYFYTLILPIQWAEKFEKTMDTSPRVIYIILTALFISSIFACLKAFAILGKSAQFSRQLHARMTFRLLHSKMCEFIERTPFGRIVNRFTGDIEIIDRVIPPFFDISFMLFFIFLISLAIVIFSTKSYLIFGLLLLYLIIGLVYREWYIRLKRDLTRMDSITRSPLVGWGSALVYGAPIIRCMEKQKFCKDKMHFFIEENVKNGVLGYATDSWFMTRLALCNFFLVVLPSYAFIYYHLYFSTNNMSEGTSNLVLFITKSTSLSKSYSALLRFICELETLLVAVERCNYYEKLEPEEQYSSVEEDGKIYENTKTSKNLMRFLVSKGEAPELQKNIPGEVNIQGVVAKYPSCT